MPKILQDVRKRDDKARTFAPADNDEMKNLAELNKAKLKKLDPTDYSETKKIIAKMERLKDLKRDKFSKNMNKYEGIDLDDVNGLIDEINSEILEKDNIVDLGNNKTFILEILLIFYMILKMVRLVILIKKENIKKGLKILKKS